MDPNIARLLERTQARRTELRGGSSSDCSPLPSERQRSPLKDRNMKSPSRLRSPAKSSVEIPVTHSPAKSQVSEESPSNTIRRLLARESLEKDVQDLITRQSPGKGLVTRTVSTKVSNTSPGKGGTGTTITKTVVTEKEERFEKKETISYSGNREFLKSLEPTKELESGGDSWSSETTRVVDIMSPRKRQQQSPSKQSWRNRSPVKDQMDHEDQNELLSGRKARLANLADKIKHMDDDEEEIVKEEVKLPRSVTKPPPRATSPSKHAPVNMDHLRRRSPSPTKKNTMQFVSPVKSCSSPATSTPITTSPSKSVGFRSCLASKASSVSSTTKTPSFRSVSPTKISGTAITNSTPSCYRSVSPTKATPATPHTTPTGFRSVSPSKTSVPAPDASFVTSLKAQGFQETNSKSKLVYNFDSAAPESPEMTNYADNVFLRNDEATKESSGR